jgi:hypothetical protein
MGRPNFHEKNSFPIISNYIKLAKYESCTHCCPKCSQLYQGVETFNRNNFPFQQKFKFPTNFELKIHEQIYFDIGLNFERGYNPLRKNSITSPKIFLGIIIDTATLY